MFPVLHTEWEENFQDLSGFCVTPTSRNGQDQCAAITDELNTPMIELEREEFHFNIDLSRSEPKFDSELENNWELPSPQDIVDPYSPTVIAHTAAADTMGYENSEFITFDDYDKKMNFFISDNHTEDFVLTSVGAAPLALVEGKLNKMDFLAANNGFAAETLNTPDIVRMIIEFPVKEDEKLALEALKGVNPALKDSSAIPDCLNQPSTSADVMESQGYDFFPPLPEIVEEGFDLLSFIVDDCPKPKLPASARQETAVSGQQRGKDMKKMLVCSEPLTTIAVEDLQPTPSTSMDRATTPAFSSRIKEEVCSDDDDDGEEEDDDETYLPSTSAAPKRKRSLARVGSPSELTHSSPAKRSRRATSTLSTCSEVTTASVSSGSKYRELRDRNNEASKKSRQTRKSRDQDMLKECVQMEKVNRMLKVKALEMETLVKRLRNELLTAVAKNKK